MGIFNSGLAFFTAYLKGEEARLVTSDHINRMSKASSVQDIFSIISDTDIGSYLQEVVIETSEDIDERLWMYFNSCIERIEWYKPVPPEMLKILNAYTVKYDVLNIKAALQGIVSGKKARSLPIGVIKAYGLLDALFSTGDVDSIIGLLEQCELGDFASLLRENTTDGVVKASVLSQASLDNLYYKYMLDRTRRITDGAILAKALGFIIDMTNLQLICRALIQGMGAEVIESIVVGGHMISREVATELLSLKLTDLPIRLEGTPYYNMAVEMVSSYNNTKSISIVEGIIDRHKFILTKEVLGLKLLSPLDMAWYLIIKEIEIRNLRIILKAIINSIPMEEIKNNLVLLS
ncbi:MAG: V-type ATPase subunit [Dehalococcoidales bacterium]|nr:V-type ATPase subunit [Dehalococcoidales bacterium]